VSVTFKQLTDFLMSVGSEQVEHMGKTYLAHAIGVYRDLETWGADEDVCRAGMFHSIYGTERFQKFSLPLEQRDKLQELIGQRAEQLAYWNCAMDRPEFDRAVKSEPTQSSTTTYHLLDRFTNQQVPLSPEDFEELCRIHLCDWLEQVQRAGAWDYRRDSYRRMAERLGRAALKSYDEVYATEPSKT